MYKLLLIDDEEDILKVFKYRLIKKGYDVIVGKDGQEALEILKTQKPDLILLDFRMPKLTGHDVCRIIKADPNLKHIPVILVTASPGGIDEKTIKEIGVDDVFIKSLDFNNLILKIEQLLKKS